jgi:hypothetical protein
MKRPEPERWAKARPYADAKRNIERQLLMTLEGQPGRQSAAVVNDHSSGVRLERCCSSRPSTVFVTVVPILIGLAALLLAFGERLKAMLKQRPGSPHSGQPSKHGGGFRPDVDASACPSTVKLMASWLPTRSRPGNPAPRAFHALFLGRLGPASCRALFRPCASLSASCSPAGVAT